VGKKGNKGKGKHKGSQFERDVCRILTKWVTGKEDPVIFWRTAGSGSQFTVKKGESPMCGDIMAVDPRGEPFIDYFCVECKNWRRIPIMAFLTGQEVGLLKEWWEELVGKCSWADKKPLLIFKENYQPIYALMQTSEFFELSDWVGKPERYFQVKLPWVDGVLMALVEFLDWVDIGIFEQLRKE